MSHFVEAKKIQVRREGVKGATCILIRNTEKIYTEIVLVALNIIEYNVLLRINIWFNFSSHGYYISNWKKQCEDDVSLK